MICMQVLWVCRPVWMQLCPQAFSSPFSTAALQTPMACQIAHKSGSNPKVQTLVLWTWVLEPCACSPYGTPGTWRWQQCSRSPARQQALDPTQLRPGTAVPRSLISTSNPPEAEQMPRPGLLLLCPRLGTRAPAPETFLRWCHAYRPPLRTKLAEVALVVPVQEAADQPCVSSQTGFQGASLRTSHRTWPCLHTRHPGITEG